MENKGLCIGFSPAGMPNWMVVVATVIVVAAITVLLKDLYEVSTCDYIGCRAPSPRVWDVPDYGRVTCTRWERHGCGIDLSGCDGGKAFFCLNHVADMGPAPKEK